MSNEDRQNQLAALRRLWLHVNNGGQLSGRDHDRFGFTLTRKSIETRIIELEEMEWKNV